MKLTIAAGALVMTPVERFRAEERASINSVLAWSISSTFTAACPPTLASTDAGARIWSA